MKMPPMNLLRFLSATLGAFVLLGSAHLHGAAAQMSTEEWIKRAWENVDTESKDKPANAAGTPPSGSEEATTQDPVALTSEKRVALVIGNGAYQSVPVLVNPLSDADTVAAALRTAGFANVLVVHDLSRAEFVDALRSFSKKADAADWALVYFAGHGLFFEMGGTNYLIPVDAQLASDRDVQDEAISLERVLSAVEGARKLRLVVLDACRNNPFLVAMERTSLARAVGRGLAAVEPAQATLVAYSAKREASRWTGTERTARSPPHLHGDCLSPGLKSTSCSGSSEAMS